MSPRRLVADPSVNLTQEEVVTGVFHRCDYDVEEHVGRESGTVDRIATPRTGFVRPRTYFMVLDAPPEDIQGTLEMLEAAREQSGADRAVGVIMEGRLPAGYAPDLAHRTANVLTFRRWFLEVSGIADELRGWAVTEPGEQVIPYLPRRARLDTGEEVDADNHIDHWLTLGNDRPPLAIRGPSRSGKTTTLRAAIARVARRFISDPDTHTPLYFWDDNDIVAEADLRGFIVPCVTRARTVITPQEPSLYEISLEAKAALRPINSLRIIHLLPLTREEVTVWFDLNAQSAENARRTASALQVNQDFMALAQYVPNLPPLLDAVRGMPTQAPEPSLDQWIASVIVEYMERIESAPPRAQYDRELENAALEQFALGVPSKKLLLSVRMRRSEFGWLDREGGQFINDLIRDYFVARKIIREVHEGNNGILLRYQFPPFVFLFISLVAPDVSAQISGGTLGRMEQRIREEVERIAQLGFAHRLNRPVGSMRQYLGEIKESLDQTQQLQLARAFGRIEEEIDYIAKLADKTRQWQAGPTGTSESIELRTVVDDELGPLGQQYPHTFVRIDVSHELRVNAIADALHEALHCLLENAFHAAACSDTPSQARVSVCAGRIGDVIRIEVEDSGSGVNPADRENIFEPFKTTKTGGAGKPRGTGLGLAIAKRFVEGMGGRIALDASRACTCFFIELVAGRVLP